MKKFLETDHPAFKPLWVRLLIVAVAVSWGIVELLTASPFWAMVFLGLGIYCIWAFFFDFHPDGRGQDKGDADPGA